MTRKQALAAIADFADKAAGDPDDKAEAQRLLKGLQDLDPKIMRQAWIE